MPAGREVSGELIWTRLGRVRAAFIFLVLALLRGLGPDSVPR
jgi:hypothetical protein